MPPGVFCAYHRSPIGLISDLGISRRAPTSLAKSVCYIAGNWSLDRAPLIAGPQRLGIKDVGGRICDNDWLGSGTGTAFRKLYGRVAGSESRHK